MSLMSDLGISLMDVMGAMQDPQKFIVNLIHKKGEWAEQKVISLVKNVELTEGEKMATLLIYPVGERVFCAAIVFNNDMSISRTLFDEPLKELLIKLVSGKTALPYIKALPNGK